MPGPEQFIEPVQQIGGRCPECGPCTVEAAGWIKGLLDAPLQFMRGNFAWLEWWLIPAILLGGVVLLALIPGTRRMIREVVTTIACLFKQRRG